MARITKKQAALYLHHLEPQLEHPEYIIKAGEHRFLTHKGHEYYSTQNTGFSFEAALEMGILWIQQPKDRMGAEIFPQRIPLNDRYEAAQCKGTEFQNTFKHEIDRATDNRTLLLDISLLEQIAQGRPTSTAHPRINTTETTQRGGR